MVHGGSQENLLQLRHQQRDGAALQVNIFLLANLTIHHSISSLAGKNFFDGEPNGLAGVNEPSVFTHQMTIMLSGVYIQSRVPIVIHVCTQTIGCQSVTVSVLACSARLIIRYLYEPTS
jgi:hypothetical protein